VLRPPCRDDDRQLAALKRTGCDRVFTDYSLVRGEPREPARMLAQAVAALTPGDELVTWRRARLGPQAVSLEVDLAARGIVVRCVAETDLPSD
jgi:hypothetical protein